MQLTRDQKYKNASQHNTCSLNILIYALNDDTLADEIYEAAKDGVQVRIIIDGSTKTPTELIRKLKLPFPSQFPFAKPIEIYKAAIKLHRKQTGSPDIVHEKLTTIKCKNNITSKDEGFALFGSYNFTNGARYKNFENCVLLKVDDLSQQDSIISSIKTLLGRFDLVKSILEHPSANYLETLHSKKIVESSLNVVGTPKPLSPSRHS